MRLPGLPGRDRLLPTLTAPGPSGPAMLPALPGIKRNPVGYLMRVWSEYGDVVQFPIPQPPSYLVNDPAGVRRVLVGNARNYGKATIQYRSLQMVTGNGLLTADGDQWRRQRPLVQPAFHRESLPAVAAAVLPAAERLTAKWAAAGPGGVVDVDGDMMKAALEVVGTALLGTDLSGDAEDLTTATIAALDVVIARSGPSLPEPSWLPTPNNRKLHAALDKLDTAVAHLLTARQQADPGEPATDMVAMLLAARDTAGARLSREEIRNQLVTFIVAGHETVASALTWAYALLASDGQVQKELAAEADRVLGDRPAQFCDYAELTYTRAVIDEALRLYPPAWLITRNALGPDTLGAVEIPAGALIILSPWLLHRHPDKWTDPERFVPGRFLTGEADRTAFIPFGAGPRQCIGRDFAYVESVLLLATLAARFSVAYPPGRGIPDFEPLVTVRPRGGLALTVTPR
ncbi:MAG: cytochrome P450 [Candidatus Nanopelagicales bacterium]